MSNRTHQPDIQYPDYLQGKLRIMGTPKTAILRGNWNGETYEAPLECWIACLVDILTPEQKSQFFPILKKAYEQWNQQKGMAEARAIIPVPNYKG